MNLPDYGRLDCWWVHVNIEFASDKESYCGGETRFFLQHLWWLLLYDECTETWKNAN